MFARTYSLRTLTAVLFIATAASVSASNETLKLAIVEGSVANKAISYGDFSTSLDKLSSHKPSANNFNNTTGLCVTLIKSNQMAKAKVACSNAVEDAQAIPESHRKSAYLRSLSYSNRAIAHYKNNDVSAAITDIEIAVATDNNPIVVNNLQTLKQRTDSFKIEAKTDIAD